MTRPSVVSTQGRSGSETLSEDRVYLRQETGSGTTGEGMFSLLHPGFVGRKEKAGRAEVKVEMGEFGLGSGSGWFVVCL